MNFSDLKTILSAVFIIFGSGVFYLSSLISGHNIYRDFSFNLAMLVTTIIGFILFIFSPISFVILFPEFFGIDSVGHILGSLHRVSGDSAIIATVTRIHELVLQDLILEFISMAFGLGLVFGCLSAIDARAAFLQWIKSSQRQG